MNYIDSFNINKTDYDVLFLRNVGVNEVTSLSNLPTDKRLIHATLSDASSLSIQGGMEVGENLVVICECNGNFELNFQPNQNYKFLTEEGILESIICQNDTRFKIYITKLNGFYVVNLSNILNPIKRYNVKFKVTPSNATVKYGFDSWGQWEQSVTPGDTIRVPEGKTIYYQITATGYNSTSGNQRVNGNVTISKTLIPKTYNVKFNITPLNATVKYSINDTSYALSTTSTGTVRAEYGQTIYYQITATGYKTITGNQLVNGNVTISKTLIPKTYNVKFNITPSNATVKYSINNTSYNYSTTGTGTVRAEYGQTIYYQITATGYKTITGSQRVNGNVTIYKTMTSVEFTIHISKTISDPANMVTVTGSDPESLLSKFRRCLCKKVSDNNVKICYLNDNNSNQYHDGTTAKTDGSEGDVMVYFPEFWYLGTDTDNEWIMNISMEEKSRYNHAPASLVGAYKAYVDGNWGSVMYSRSGVDSSNGFSMDDLSGSARNRGAGYHLIDYQQHCIIAWMFYARYKNTNSQAICGTGEDAYSSINCGVTNSLGMNDTTAESASESSNMLVNFLGLEGCWGYKHEFIEGIHTYSGNGVIAYDKGDYHDQPFSSVQSPTKRILRAHFEDDLRGYISKIEGGKYMDMFPAETSGNRSTYFCDYCSVDPSGSFVFNRSAKSTYEGVGGVAFLGGDSSPHTVYSNYGSRLAFDGNIVNVDNVSTFKALPIIS